MKKDIFISYRRQGGENLAQLIYFQLTNDGYSVFLDVESLRAGKFNEALYEKIEECVDFVLVLPPKAMDRCNNEGDWLRLEIAHAIKHKKNIIPVMMPDFEFPSKDKLPEEIRDVPDFHGVETHRRYFQSMIGELETKFLHAPKNPAGKHATGEGAPQIVEQKEAESLIYVKDYFRCPECGARKIRRQDGLDSLLLLLSGVKDCLRWLEKLLMCAMVVDICIPLSLTPEARESLKSWLMQSPLMEHLFNVGHSGFWAWLPPIIVVTLLPGVILMLVNEGIASLHDKIWRKELEEGPHSVRCRCRSCGKNFLAVSSDKLAEDWMPEEEEEE